MDFSSIAADMYPFWIMGILVMLATVWSGNKKLLKIQGQTVFRWCIFLLLITAARTGLYSFLGYLGLGGPPRGLAGIPWVASLTVFWEDACHGLPLVILQGLIGTKKRWAKVVNWLALGIVSLSFGLAHVYQGLLAAVLTCCYVFYSMQAGKKYGFGTVMVCHSLYDMVTFLFMKFFTRM